MYNEASIYIIAELKAFVKKRPEIKFTYKRHDDIHLIGVLPKNVYDNPDEEFRQFVRTIRMTVARRFGEGAPFQNDLEWYLRHWDEEPDEIIVGKLY